MSSDIVLTSALRNNLLSLQNTQRLIDTTQQRLATGLKVNSALDNPQNFFAAQSLNNRASDLSRLLDGIGQSIRTIEAADTGITALTSLITQAQAITTSAREELASSEGEARLVGNVNLNTTSIDDLVADTSITAGDVLRIITTDSTGARVVEDVAISAGDTGFTLAARITDQFADNREGQITAEITDQGFLAIQSSDGRSFKLTTTAANELNNADLTALGINQAFEVETRTTAGTALNAATVISGSTITSVSLFESFGNTAEAGDLLSAGFTNAAGNAALTLAVGDSLSISINDNGTIRNSTAVTGASTFQDFVDSINLNSTINQLVRAEFNSETGQLSLTSLSDNVRNVQFIPTSAAGVVNLGFGDPNGNLDPIAVAGGAEDYNFFFNNSTSALDGLAADYNALRAQIDGIVQDAQFRGVNLLNGDNLVTFFNEDNTNSLTSFGGVFSASGLGLTEASFRSLSDIETTATQARNALGEVRSFGSSLANSLSIIETRQSFTQSTINTLESGADDLTVADANEEGANLLALQTRQALGTTALSLASQSAQSVLRLF